MKVLLGHEIGFSLYNVWSVNYIALLLGLSLIQRPSEAVANCVHYCRDRNVHISNVKAFTAPGVQVQLAGVDVLVMLSLPKSM